MRCTVEVPPQGDVGSMFDRTGAFAQSESHAVLRRSWCRRGPWEWRALLSHHLLL